MPSVYTAIAGQIERATLALVGAGIVADQNMPIRSRAGRRSVISLESEVAFSDVQADMTYRELHALLQRHRLFNIRFRDGGVMQLHYEFDRGHVVSHRLAFLPAPDLEPLQAEPDLYLDDAQELFADWLEQRTVPVPLRFDHDVRAARGLDHPASHLTLGQFTRCRIPVTSPLYPVQFFQFILQNFYNVSFRRFSDALPRSSAAFPRCASEAEYGVIHVGVPGSSRYPG